MILRDRRGNRKSPTLVAGFPFRGAANVWLGDLDRCILAATREKWREVKAYENQCTKRVKSDRRLD